MCDKKIGKVINEIDKHNMNVTKEQVDKFFEDHPEEEHNYITIYDDDYPDEMRKLDDMTACIFQRVVN